MWSGKVTILRVLFEFSTWSFWHFWKELPIWIRRGWLCFLTCAEREPENKPDDFFLFLRNSAWWSRLFSWKNCTHDANLVGGGCCCPVAKGKNQYAPEPPKGQNNTVGKTWCNCEREVAHVLQDSIHVTLQFQSCSIRLQFLWQITNLQIWAEAAKPDSAEEFATRIQIFHFSWQNLLEKTGETTAQSGKNIMQFWASCCACYAVLILG